MTPLITMEFVNNTAGILTVVSCALASVRIVRRKMHLAKAANKQRGKNNDRH